MKIIMFPILLAGYLPLFAMEVEKSLQIDTHEIDTLLDQLTNAPTGKTQKESPFPARFLQECDKYSQKKVDSPEKKRIETATNFLRAIQLQPTQK